jgi:hypothetical protein
MLEAAYRRDAKPPRDVAKIQRELTQRAAERQRLIDLCVKGLITAEEFDQRAAKLAAEVHDLEAVLPRTAESVMDHRATATATVHLLAEFPYLALPEQHALARRVFIAFDVADDGRAIAGAVMRPAVQEYMKNGTRLRPCF